MPAGVVEEVEARAARLEEVVAAVVEGEVVIVEEAEAKSRGGRIEEGKWIWRGSLRTVIRWFKDPSVR